MCAAYAFCHCCCCAASYCCTLQEEAAAAAAEDDNDEHVKEVSESERGETQGKERRGMRILRCVVKAKKKHIDALIHTETQAKPTTHFLAENTFSMRRVHMRLFLYKSNKNHKICTREATTAIIIITTTTTTSVITDKNTRNKNSAHTYSSTKSICI